MMLLLIKHPLNRKQRMKLQMMEKHSMVLTRQQQQQRRRRRRPEQTTCKLVSCHNPWTISTKPKSRTVPHCSNDSSSPCGTWTRTMRTTPPTTPFSVLAGKAHPSMNPFSSIRSTAPETCSNWPRFFTRYVCVCLKTIAKNTPPPTTMSLTVTVSLSL